MKAKRKFQMKAVYKTKCPVCGFWIWPGESITKRTSGWQHPACCCDIERDNMEEEALDFFSFNVECAHFGDNDPLYVQVQL